MVLALSLPQHFPFREMLINLVFGVVLLTILIQGLSISPVARALGGAEPQATPRRFRDAAHASDPGANGAPGD